VHGAITGDVSKIETRELLPLFVVMFTFFFVASIIVGFKPIKDWMTKSTTKGVVDQVKRSN